MTRVEGTMATPDPPLDKPTKVVPCPAHLKGHPTFVVTQLTPVSAPFASQLGIHSQRQSLSPLPKFHTLSSRQANQTRSSDSSEDQERLLMDKQTAFEPRLWSLVAPSFHPQTIQSQRPTAADTVVDLSDSHTHVSTYVVLKMLFDLVGW